MTGLVSSGIRTSAAILTPVYAGRVETAPRDIDLGGAPDAVRAAIGPGCEHVPASIATPSNLVCEECGSAFNLRLCATCGHVGCCESQAGHGREHALGQHHPVILQMPAGQGFTWCYADDRYV
jgi:hypothetical protein